MHSRSIENFPSRMDSRRSNSLSRMNHKIQRTVTPLKSGGEMKGPSPTSVTTKSFQYDNEEPFDCGPSSSSGQKDLISKRNVPPKGPTGNTYKHSAHTRAKVPPLSPRPYSTIADIRSKHTDRPPKSPTGREGSRISTQKASTFRQRRMQIAQQRKWTEERIEQVPYHSRSMNQVDEHEIESDRIPSTLKGHMHSSAYLIDEEVYCDPEEVHVSSSHEIDEDSDDDSALECMTIDTVSSLNTHWTNRSDDAFSARSWLPPKPGNMNGTPTQKRSKDSFPLKHMTATYSVHPPLFVSSKKHRKQVNSKLNSKEDVVSEPNLSADDEEEEHFDPEVTIQINNSGRDREYHPDSIHEDRSNLDNDPLIMYESMNDTSILSSSSTYGERPSSPGERDHDNDIPMISSMNSIHRERPSPQTFLEKGVDKSLSLDEQKDPSNLRKKRLSKMISSQLCSDVMGQDPHDEEDQHDVADNNMVLEHSSERWTSPKTRMETSVDGPGSQPFDESAIINLHDALINSPNLERKLDSDLYNVMKQRELEDEKSVQTSKSFMTMATMKTCFTTKPTSPEELEIAMKRKKHRMYLFHHALSCTHPHPDNADDESYVPCPEVKHCHAVSVLVRHAQKCDSNCEVPRCNSYKRAWNHYRRCAVRTFTSEKKDCRFCSDFWHKCEPNQDC